MCNLYNATTTHEAMRQLFLLINDLTNRLTPQMDVFPDYPAPIGRKDANGERELAIARWGMPTPPQFLKGEVDYGVTNIRNVKSPH
jgi:putative SOS response-associated peptidase YedK